MDEVALAATIGGSAVGLAGVLGNAWNTWIQRRQAGELAAAQQEHERKLASGERLFERRAPVYEAMIGSVHALMEHVEAELPILQVGGAPALPPQPSLEEQRLMQSKLRTYGSPAVADALDRFVKGTRMFYIHASTYETIRAQGGQIGDERTNIEAAREEARDAMRSLEHLVSEELASL